jgi:radical SAM protein with 4Fe4S-binding SPASM domain
MVSRLNPKRRPAITWMKFYRTGFEHILEINKKGYGLAEVYAKILLTKILTPYGTGYVDLQSPAGAGMSVLVYNYDGNVYATDESRMLAEMGDHTFRLGNVRQHSHREIFAGDAFLNLASASCNQSLTGCSDCAFQPYCGSDPIYNHATQGDLFGHRPTSDFCKRNMEIIKYLLRLLSQQDKETMRMFWAWIQNSRIKDINRVAPS